MGQPSEMPDSPISNVEAVGHELHTVYQANRNAGFTETQALYLLAATMTGNPGIAPGATLPDPPGMTGA